VKLEPLLISNQLLKRRGAVASFINGTSEGKPLFYSELLFVCNFTAI